MCNRWWEWDCEWCVHVWVFENLKNIIIFSVCIHSYICLCSFSEKSQVLALQQSKKSVFFTAAFLLEENSHVRKEWGEKKGKEFFRVHTCFLLLPLLWHGILITVTTIMIAASLLLSPPLVFFSHCYYHLSPPSFLHILHGM